MGLPRPAPSVGPECVLGIELSPYAAELARVSTWIAEIQWMRRNGFEASKDPILKPLGTIECRDAVLAEDDTAAAWPEADFIVGNPPFLGTSRMVGEMGEEYPVNLRRAWPQVPGAADLVAFWIAGAWNALRSGRTSRVGLVTTNSIRGGANRLVLKPIVEEARIFEAWSDEPWFDKGTAVRVSMVMFDSGGEDEAHLDGLNVERIASDLSADIDLTVSQTLNFNRNIAFLGTKKGGPFDIDGIAARKMLISRGNPNGRQNSDVIFRRWTGRDMAQRPADRWIIDFGISMQRDDAAYYEKPFQHVLEHVKPVRDKNRREWRRLNYWLHSETAPGWRNSIKALKRYIGTPRVAKHRTFIWLDAGASVDDGTIAIARDDDTTFGILHSRFHEAWSLRMGTSLEDRPRYTPSTTFETFPFPEGLTPDIPAATYADDPRAQAIAAAAQDLNDKREVWLNPPDLVRRVPEVVEGYPDRLIPVDEAAAKELNKRTLTNLYNSRPAWLDGLHRRLDAAVAAAYGWPEDIAQDDALARLLALNRMRSGKQALPDGTDTGAS